MNMSGIYSIGRLRVLDVSAREQLMNRSDQVFLMRGPVLL